MNNESPTSEKRRKIKGYEKEEKGERRGERRKNIFRKDNDRKKKVEREKKYWKLIRKVRSPVGWGCRIHWLTSVLWMMLNNMMMRFQ